MGTHRRRIASLAAMTAAVALAVASVVANRYATDVARAAGREDLLASDAWFAFVLTGLAFSVPAVMIHWHRSNLVGWVMHGIGILFAGSMIGFPLYIYDSIGAELTTAGRVMGAWSDRAWIPAVLLVTVLLPLLFPTGRPPSRRWWWTAAVGGAGVAYAFIEVTFGSLTRPIREVSDGPLTSSAMVVGTLGAIASVIVRYRRAGDVERHQIKWVSAALVLACTTVAVALTPPLADLFTRAWIQLVFMAAWWTIPVSVGIAITRRRLYDIDRIISRTVSYAVVALMVAAVYAGVVVVLGTAFGSRSDLAVAASTLAAAAVVRPAQRRVQVAADRRFNRPRYHAQRELDAFALRLRDSVELTAVADDVAGVVRRTLHPSSLTLWIRGGH